MIELIPVKGTPPFLGLLPTVRGERSVLLSLNALITVPLGLRVAQQSEAGDGSISLHVYRLASCCSLTVSADPETSGAGEPKKL